MHYSGDRCNESNQKSNSTKKYSIKLLNYLKNKTFYLPHKEEDELIKSMENINNLKKLMEYLNYGVEQVEHNAVNILRGITYHRDFIITTLLKKLRQDNYPNVVDAIVLALDYIGKVNDKKIINELKRYATKREKDGDSIGKFWNLFYVSRTLMNTGEDTYYMKNYSLRNPYLQVEYNKDKVQFDIVYEDTTMPYKQYVSTQLKIYQNNYNPLYDERYFKSNHIEKAMSVIESYDKTIYKYFFDLNLIENDLDLFIRTLTISTFIEFSTTKTIKALLQKALYEKLPIFINGTNICSIEENKIIIIKKDDDFIKMLKELAINK